MTETKTRGEWPTKPKYRPEYCEQLIEHMSEGKSYEAFAAKIRTSRETLYNWEEVHPEWKEAKKIAVEGFNAIWEQLAFNTAAGLSKGNATMIQFMLRNRDPDRYKDKQQVEHTGQVSFVVDTGIKRLGDPGYTDWIEADTVKPKVIENLSSEEV